MWPERRGLVVRGGKAGAEAITNRTLANIVKRYAARAGLAVESFSGHSLRAGFATSAAEAGEGLENIAWQMCRRALGTVTGYVRQASLFSGHAGARFL